MAFRNRQVSVLRLLLENGANAGLKNKYEQTVLEAAQIEQERLQQDLLQTNLAGNPQELQKSHYELKKLEILMQLLQKEAHVESDNGS